MTVLGKPYVFLKYWLKFWATVLLFKSFYCIWMCTYFTRIRTCCSPAEGSPNSKTLQNVATVARWKNILYHRDTAFWVREPPALLGLVTRDIKATVSTIKVTSRLHEHFDCCKEMYDVDWRRWLKSQTGVTAWLTCQFLPVDLLSFTRPASRQLLPLSVRTPVDSSAISCQCCS